MGHMPISFLINVIVTCAVMAALIAMVVFSLISSRHNTWWRRVVFVLFPLSQVSVMGIAYYVIFTYHATIESLVLVSLCALLCVPVDIFLTRSLVATEDRDLARLQIAMLEENMALQRESYARIQTDAQAAKNICTQAHSQLEQAYDALRQKQVGCVKDDLAQTLSIIENQGRHYCENRVVDALVGMKMKQCCESGINAEFDLAIPRDSGISSTDLCALFSNLLDNAIHACTDMSANAADIPYAAVKSDRDFNPQGRIRLTASVVGSMMVVDMSNSMFHAPAARFWRRKPASGLDEHGWGLVILKELARRYGGSVATAQKDGLFITTVILHSGGKTRSKVSRTSSRENGHIQAGGSAV